MSERADNRRLIGLLLIVMLFGLAAGWWLSLVIVVDSSIMDVTTPEAAVAVGVAILLGGVISGRLAWPSRSDRVALGLLAGMVGWLLVAALVRSEPSELRSIAAFGGIAIGSCWIAVAVASRAPEVAARALLVFVVAAILLSFGGALLERAVYPEPGHPDAFAWLWSFFRPQLAMFDPNLGQLSPPAIHFPSGDPGVPRASGWFAHTNYLAFFAILTAPVGTLMAVRGMQDRSWWVALVGAGLLSMTILMALWTYSRTGIVGTTAAIGIALAGETLIRFRRMGALDGAMHWRSIARLPARTLIAPIIVAAFAGVLIVGGGLTDRVLWSRLGAAASPNAGAAASPNAGAAAGVEESARRSSEIRLAMQRSAIEMIVSGPATLAFGPGMNAYERAIHTPDSPRYLAAARGVRDPNSSWLSMGLAGGLPAAVLFAAVIVLAWVRVARRALRSSGVRAIVLIWLAAWLPIWALAQIFGTFPFFAGEAVILWTFVGLAIGLTSNVDSLASS